MEGEKSDVLFRLFRKGDEEEIIPLFKLAFDEWRDRGEGASDYWEWLFEDNPLRSNLIVVLVSDDKIVSVNAGLNTNIKICDQTVPGAYGAFVIVHPDYRRGGIFTETFDFKKERLAAQGIRLNYMYTVSPVVRQIALKLHQFPFPHTVLRYLRVRDVGLHTRIKNTERPLLSGWGYKAIVAAQKMRKALSGPTRVRKEFEVSEIECFDERADAFWDKVSKHYNFIVERNRGYLNWRYCDPRSGDYMVLQAEDDEGVLGYASIVVVEKTLGYPEGYILDLLTMPERLDVSNRLVEVALMHFDSNDVNAVHSLAVEGHPYEDVLKRNGFVNRREEVWLHYFGYDIEEMMKQVGEGPPDTIHFSHGDLYAV